MSDQDRLNRMIDSLRNERVALWVERDKLRASLDALQGNAVVLPDDWSSRLAEAMPFGAPTPSHRRVVDLINSWRPPARPRNPYRPLWNETPCQTCGCDAWNCNAATDDVDPATSAEPRRVRFQLKHSDQYTRFSSIDPEQWLTGVVLLRYDDRTVIRAGNYRFAHTVLDEHVMTEAGAP